MSASFRCDRRLFHSPGPAALDALSPKVLYVRVTTHVRLAVERSRRSRASATRRQSSARYSGEMPDSDWCTSVATLKLTRWRTGSQCSWRSTGDMWSERRVPVTRRAAAFWTDCSRFISLQRCRRTASCSSPGGRKRTPGLMSYSHLQTTTGQPAAAGATGSSRFDRPQWREPIYMTNSLILTQQHHQC